MKKKILSSACYSLIIKTCLILFPYMAVAQVYTNKEVGKKNEALADSIKKAGYPYSLPIWGAKAAKAGYNLPYSAGLGVQYIWQQSTLVIDNLEVGFNDGPKYNLDGLVRFDKAQSTGSATAFRPDFWLFPFLNVYGIFGTTSASTEVGFGVWIPDSTNTEKEIFSMGSKVDFNSHTMGFGLTPTIGLGGGWLALNMSFTWTDVPQLEDPAFAFTFGPRMGKTFRFRKPERNISIWAGGFRVSIASETNGSLALGEVLPTDELEEKVQIGIDKVGDAQVQVDAWWAGLTPVEQNNPVNQAKYNAANAALDKAGQVLYAAEDAINTAGNSTVQYSMEKRQENKWNFVVGSQYQFNKHWQVRAEVGFLGSRNQFQAGIQYRFGL